MGRGGHVRIAALAAALLLGLASSSARADEVDATGPDATAIAAGLESLAGALAGLDSLEELSAPVPFTELVATGPDGLRLADVFGEALGTPLSGQSFGSVHALENFLDGLDATFGGVAVTVDAAIAPHTGPPYEITLELGLARAVTTPFSIVEPLALSGGAVDSALTAEATLELRYAGGELFLPGAADPAVGTSFSSAGPGSFAAEVGFTRATATGLSAASAEVLTAINDPDADGRVTQEEWETTAPVDLFDPEFTSSSADLSLALQSDVPGIDTPAEAGTLAVDDSDLSDGVDALAVDLGPLADFANISPQDFLTGLAHTGIALQALQVTGPAAVRLPFVEGELGDLLTLNAGLIDFFVGNGLSQLEDPLSLSVDEEALEPLDTIQEAAAALQAALAISPADFGLAYDPVAHQLRFSIDAAPPADTAALPLDLTGRLRGVGVDEVDTGGGEADVSSSYVLDLGISLDLSPHPNPEEPESLLDRFALETTGDDVTAEVSVLAPIEGAAQIGFLPVGVAGAASPVTLLAPRAGDPDPTLSIDLDGGPDERLTLTELFDGLNPAEDDPADPGDGLAGILANEDDAVNASVPPFDLEVTALFRDGAQEVGGTLTVAVEDVAVGEVEIEPDEAFVSALLPFDFAPDNPRALHGLALNALGALTEQLGGVVATTESLHRPVPLIGTTFAGFYGELGGLEAATDELAATPLDSLSALEHALEAHLALLLGDPAIDASALVEVEHVQSPGEPPAAVLRLGYGVCSSAAADCDSVRPVDVQFNLEGIPTLGQLVGAVSGGTVPLGYRKNAELAVGVQLPEVEPGAELPTPDGEAEPFVLDTTSLGLDEALDADNGFNGLLGGQQVEVGRAPVAETACADAVDNDLDGFVDDGCPAVDTPEPTLSCINGLDDDGDGVANDGCPATGFPITARVEANYHLSHDFGDTGPTQIGLGDDLIDYANELIPGTSGFYRPATQFTCPGLTGDFDACASLPIHLDPGGTAASVGSLAFGAEDLSADPSTWTFSVPAGLTTAFEGEELDWLLMEEGVAAYADTIRRALDGAQYRSSLPLLGTRLDAGAQIVEEYEQYVVDAFAGFEPVGTTAGAVRSSIESFLSSSLGPSSDAELLIGTPEVLLTCSSVACDDSVPAAAITKAELRFSVGRMLDDAELGFESGLPGLRLSATTPLKADVDWQLDLAFELGGAGFAVNTEDTEEIRVDAAGAVEPTLDGNLADVLVELTDQSPGDELELHLSVDIKAAGHRLTLAQILAGRNPSNPAHYATTLDGGVHLDLGLETLAQLPGSLLPGEGALPTLLADFVLDWSWAGASPTALPDAGLDIRFDDVQLDLGSFTDDFFGPALREFQRFTRPLKPAIDTLTAPIPVIAQLSKLAGKKPPTLLDLFQKASGADVSLVRRIIQLADLINNLPEGGGIVPLGSFALDIPVVREAALTADQAHKLIRSGSAALNPAVSGAAGVLGLLSNGGPLQNAMSGGGLTLDAFQSPLQLFDFLVGENVTFAHWDLGRLNAGFGFSTGFPFFAGPIPLTVFVSGAAEARGRLAAGYDSYGLRQAVRTLSDDDPTNDDVFTDASTLALGFFLDDLDGKGVDVPELQLMVEFSAGAAVNFAVISAGVAGGVTGLVDMNLHDGGPFSPPPPENLDGKLRVDEVLPFLNNPICLFDVSGQIDAFLRAFAKIGVGPFKKTFSITLVELTLLKMSDLAGACFEPPKPVLATIDGTVLRLNMGPFAEDRKIETDKVDERFVVRQLDESGTRFSVTAFGFYQEFESAGPDPETPGPPLTIFADGGSGSDLIAIENGSHGVAPAAGGVEVTAVPFTQPAVICGGPGSDRLAGGDAADVLVGDGAIGSGYSCSSAPADSDGADQVSGRGGNDFVVGLGGGDLLVGDDGDDSLDGGTGSDNVNGGLGADTLIGGDDPDELEGGPEIDPASSQGAALGITPTSVADTIFGGAGEDSVEGDSGADVVFGGPDPDVLVGSKGNDTIFGEGGDDVLSGAQGGDSLNGGPGDDDLLGQQGSDTLNGGEDGDDLVGGPDGGTVGDTLNGGPGRDYLVGDDGMIQRAPGTADALVTLATTWSGDDLLNGEGDNDVVFGQGGNDTINGGDGDDELTGSTGADLMNGDPGNDLMFGDAGIDTMNGGSGFDTMRGGTEADLMHGDPDGDTMFGDSGADRIFGDGGADVIRGGIDADYVEGNDDGDTISGDAAADEIYGNAGNDAIRGNAGDDDVEGNDGDDTIGGDSGHDDILGGSGGGGAADGSDTITGNSGHDVIAGDNAALSRPGGTEPDGSVRRHVFLWDVGEDIGAADTISGDEGNDDIWGQAGGDTLHGNTGDDYLEGNAGDDVMFGDQAQDDLIGGTTQGGGATADGADEIHGGDSHDLIAGDNASISRGEWLRESFWVDVQDVVRRDVTLFDIATVEEDAPVGSAGGDRIFGDGGYDVVYGQGGDDEAHGGDGDDYVEGNAGGDMLDGDGGADDVMGGSPVAGRLDGGDTIHGGDSFDVIAGDNAVFTRPRDDNGLWIADTFAADAADVMRRDVTLLEVGQVAGGDDQLHGDGAFDRIFAQYGADLVHGGDGDDYAEGNEGADELHGDAGQDDLAGGGSAADGVIDADRRGDGLGDAADTIHGEDAGDVIAGDNARILRATPWATDPNTGDVVRDVLLFDVGQTDSGGADTAFGGGGHDLVFGQGNGPGVDDDGDGRVDEDPADGIDNDRDGRENPASNRGYDCADGRGDDADPDCLAHIDEDGRGDELHGGDGYDVIEGNHGSDLLFGDDGEDDVLGGSSAGDGHIGGGVAPTNLPDGHDVIRAGGEDDVVLADNGTIARGATWTMLTGVGGFDLPARVTTMATTPESVGAYGHDWVSGDDGHDDLYGQLGRDYLEGNTGEDAIVGDLGLITNNLLGDGLNDPAQFDRGIASRQPFLSAVVDRRGSLYRLVELYSFLTGQNGGEADVARGGEGHDSIHMGPGDDLASGGNGPDAVFGGDDADTLWGSGDDDHLYGGYGDDYLDVEPRPQMNSAPSDLPSWFEIGVGSYLGVDIVHGGWDRDALQANVGGPGPQPGDRLIDWVGAYDVFYVCPGAYGEGYITRANSPSVEEFLRALSSDDGALAPRTAGSSGYRELAYVLPNESRYNASPPHPDHPGHFTCGLS